MTFPVLRAAATGPMPAKDLAMPSVAASATASPRMVDAFHC